MTVVWTPEGTAAEKSLRAALASLRSASRAMQDATDPVEAGASLRRITREVDHLSSAALRFATLLGRLPRATTVAPTSDPSAADSSLLGLAQAVLAQIADLSAGRSLICDCGGLRRVPGA